MAFKKLTKLDSLRAETELAIAQMHDKVARQIEAIKKDTPEEQIKAIAKEAHTETAKLLRDYDAKVQKVTDAKVAEETANVAAKATATGESVKRSAKNLFTAIKGHMVTSAVKNALNGAGIKLPQKKAQKVEVTLSPELINDIIAQHGNAPATPAGFINDIIAQQGDAPATPAE